MFNYFARQNLVLPPKVGKMLSNIRVLIAGVGAGGNAILTNLVLMGVRNITLVDFDYVEDSNLSRTVLFRKKDIGKSKALVAAERLKEMALSENPHIVGLHGNIMTDFGKGQLFMDHDIVISCIDTLQGRSFINDWCVRTNTPFFEMGFEGYTTNVTFFAPEDGYEQITDGKVIEKLPTDDGFFPKIIGRFNVCLREDIGQGDFDGKRHSCSGFKITDTSLSKIPTIQTAASMAGTFVATELIKYLSGKDSMRNKILHYYGLTHETICCNYKPNPHCTIHQENIPIYCLDISQDDTIGCILDKIHEKWNALPLIHVPSFVFNGNCACCGKKMIINKLESEIYNNERWCLECRSLFEDYEHHLEYPNQWNKTSKEIHLDSDESLLKLRPSDIGIPRDDILSTMLLYQDHVDHVFIRLHCT